MGYFVCSSEGKVSSLYHKLLLGQLGGDGHFICDIACRSQYLFIFRLSCSSRRTPAAKILSDVFCLSAYQRLCTMHLLYSYSGNFRVLLQCIYYPLQHGNIYLVVQAMLCGIRILTHSLTHSLIMLMATSSTVGCSPPQVTAVFLCLALSWPRLCRCRW